MRNYSTTKVAQARSLRQNATEVERKLWSHLRKKQIGGLRFRRQHPLGPYIVDFFCGSARLVVELDGDQHGEDQNEAYDQKRTLWIEAQGYRVVRFSNSEFFARSECGNAGYLECD